MDFDKTLELNPEYTKAYFNRGGAKYKSGAKKGILADIKKATELNPALKIPPELLSLNDADSE